MTGSAGQIATGMVLQMRNVFAGLMLQKRARQMRAAMLYCTNLKGPKLMLRLLRLHADRVFS